jgi:phosphoglycolate phosphatase
VKRPVDLMMFDLDGTLADTGRDLANSVNFTRGRFDLVPLAPRLVYGHIGRGVDHLLKHAVPEAAPEHFQEIRRIFLEHYEEHLLDQTVLYPGIREMLDDFRGKRRAVVSNKIHRLAIKLLKGLGAENCFDAIFGGDSAAEKKPHPALLNAALEKFQTVPGRAVMVGDGEIDIQAGRRARVMTCGVIYGLGDKDDLIAAGPDVIINEPAELANCFL